MPKIQSWLFSGNSSSGGSGSNVSSPIACDSGVSVGDWVRINSLGTAVKAKADTFDNSLVIGVVITKPTSTTCTVQNGGYTPAIFAGLDTTKSYFLSWITDGAMTVSIPPEGMQAIQLGEPLTAQVFSVNKGIRLG